ncbi:MAG TPA: toll/interleukin-1 receptor domain-containing protein [Pyrinomonadaceae bacterium]
MSYAQLAQVMRVFLCHSSGDKVSVRSLYQRLREDGIEAWLDEEEILPGQDWEDEITQAVRAVDAVIVCLSRESVSKTGHVQKEIRFALDKADEQPYDP